MVKKKTRLKLPVVRRKNKWYNTITKNFVSENYAKRINNAFKKNPDLTLHQARGHGKYDPRKPMTEQSHEIRKLAYKSGTQLITTKTLRGKQVYYSPLQKDFLTAIPIQNLRALDYKIHKNVKVELYRLTRDLFNIYHYITWKVGKTFSEPLSIDFWLGMNQDIYDSIMKELKDILKKYPFSDRAIMYGNIHVYIYNDLGGFDTGIGFGFVFPYTVKKVKRHGKTIVVRGISSKAFSQMTGDFLDKLDYYKNRLEMDAYRNVAIMKIMFYIYDSTHNVSGSAKALGKYRVGIIMPQK